VPKGEYAAQLVAVGPEGNEPVGAPQLVRVTALER